MTIDHNEILLKANKSRKPQLEVETIPGGKLKYTSVDLNDIDPLSQRIIACQMSSA